MVLEGYLVYNYDMAVLWTDIKGLFQRIKLSVTQWAFILMAGAIGVLVFLFNQRGNKIHQLQVQLLEAGWKDADQQFQQQNSLAEQQVMQSQAAYQNALASYQGSKNETNNPPPSA